MIRWLLIVFVLGLILAGCGGDDDQAVWETVVGLKLPSDGTLPVAQFNDFLEETDQPWEQSAVGVATAYALPLQGDARRLETTAAPEGTSPVTVTIRGLADDSVADLRLSFVLRRNADGWTIASGSWAQLCQPGRGHQDFSTELCV